MPTIIVEDGSNVTNANSYIDVAYLETYATNFGLTIPTAEVDKEIAILNAMEYIESYRDQFDGVKTNTDVADPPQTLQWPRSEAKIDGILFDENSIPTGLQKAVAQTVVEITAGISLYPDPVTNSQEGIVTEKTIGPITKKFSGNSASGNILARSKKPVSIASVLVHLYPLLSGGSGLLPVERA